MAGLMILLFVDDFESSIVVVVLIYSLYWVQYSEERVTLCSFIWDIPCQHPGCTPQHVFLF